MKENTLYSFDQYGCRVIDGYELDRGNDILIEDDLFRPIAIYDKGTDRTYDMSFGIIAEGKRTDLAIAQNKSKRR